MTRVIRASSKVPLLRPDYEMFSTVRERLTASVDAFLREFKRREVFFLPNPGNAGDSLIHVGTYQAFRRAGVPFIPIDENADISGQVLFLGGGGNLVPHYREMRDYIVSQRVLDRVERLVILPHTIRGNEDLLAAMDDKVTIFCREPNSYSHVSKFAGTQNVYLDHDMAFHVDIVTFSSDTYYSEDLPSLFSETLSRNGVSIVAAAPSHKTAFLREDGESTRDMQPPGNIDIARLFEFGTWPGNAEKATWCLFEAIRQAARVETDRLHVGISSCILGLGCDLQDNNYGKNSDVFYHSIRKFGDLSRVVMSMPS